MNVHHVEVQHLLEGGAKGLAEPLVVLQLIAQTGADDYRSGRGRVEAPPAIAVVVDREFRPQRQVMEAWVVVALLARNAAGALVGLDKVSAPHGGLLGALA